MVTAATLDQAEALDLQRETTETGWRSWSLRGTFNEAVQMAGDAGKWLLTKPVELAYDFVKANPIMTAAAIDLSLNDGALSQKIAVNAVETIAKGLGQIATHSAKGLWGLLFE